MQAVTNMKDFEFSVELQDLFSYSLLPIFLFGILSIILLIICYLLKNRNNNTIPTIIVPNIKDRNQIKTLYLAKINELLTDFQSGNLSNRHAYQKLSILIREFIYEMTNIKVQNYTLSDIEKINMPTLYELVKEYYDPEFSKLSQGNIIQSIEKTRKVIEIWN